MDKRTFELKVQQIQQGEFVSDQSIFEYAHDSFYEMKRLFDALRQCCDWQKQKIEIIKQFNQGLERSLRKSNSVNERYRAKLIELGVDPDAL